MDIYPSTLKTRPGEKPTPETVERHRRLAQKRRAEYLRGPVPILWLIRAALLPGKAFTLAVVLRFLSGVQKTRDHVRLRPAVLERFHLNRWATRRALRALQSAALIQVERHRGRSPTITIREIEQ